MKKFFVPLALVLFISNCNQQDLHKFDVEQYATTKSSIIVSNDIEKLDEIMFWTDEMAISVIPVHPFR